MSAELRVGHKARLYRNSGDFESPNWGHVGIVKDVKINNSKGKLDGTVREDTVKKYGLDQPDIEVTLKLKKLRGNADWQALRSAYLADGDIDLWIADGDVAEPGHGGPRGEWKIANWSEDQASGAVIFNELTLVPSAESAHPFALDEISE